MSYFQKSLLYALAVLAYLPQLKKGMRLALVYFPHTFCHNSVPYLMLHHMAKFQYEAYFPSQDVKHCMF